jgi:hypothetical protein
MLSLLSRAPMRGLVFLTLALTGCGARTDIDAPLTPDLTPEHRCSKRFGSDQPEGAEGLAVDRDGNIFLSGLLFGPIDFGTGTPLPGPTVDLSAGFLVKLDPDCAPLWSKQLPNPGGETLLALTTDLQGNVIFAGELAQSSLGGLGTVVTKLGPNGEIVWARQFGSASPKQPSGIKQTQRVATDAEGNVLVAGLFHGNIDFGGIQVFSPTPSTVFLTKLDPSGATLWSRIVLVANEQTQIDIATGPLGQVVVVGSFQGTTSIGGAAVASAGSQDVFVVEVDSAGKFLWSRTFGDAAFQIARGAAFDGEGNIFVTGDFGGTLDLGGTPLLATTDTADAFVAKLDGNGTTLWSRRFGGDKAQDGERVAVTPSGDVVVGGGFGGTVDFGLGPVESTGIDTFVAALDGDGNPRWARGFGNSERVALGGLAVDGNGSVILAGSFAGTMSFGGSLLTSVDPEDVFVVKLDP